MFFCGSSFLQNESPCYFTFAGLVLFHQRLCAVFSWPTMFLFLRICLEFFLKRELHTLNCGLKMQKQTLF